MRVRFTVVLFLVAACGSGSPDEPPIDDLPSTPAQDVQSGTRLKLLWDTFDGVKVTSTFVYRDALREEYCQPHRWADGNLYCSPPPSSIVYQDAACTMPMGLVEPNDCAPTPSPPPQTALFGPDELSSCTARTTITSLRRGELRSNVPYYTKTATGCDLTVDSTAALYTLGEEVPAAAFVKLSLERTGKGRILHSHANGEDGSRLYLGTYDPLLEGECFPLPTLDGQGRTCLILGFGSVNEYSDATCTQGKASAQAACPAPKIAIGNAPEATCPDQFAAYRIAASTPALPLYDLDENRTCKAVPPDPTSAYFTLGERLPVQRFTREPIAAGAARVKPITYSDGADQFWFGELYDTQLEADCDSRRMADGSTRCVPTHATGIHRYYRDPACLQPIELIFGPSTSIPCFIQSPPRTVRVDSETCGGDPQTFSVGAAYTGPLYMNVGTFCFAYPEIPGVTYLSITPLPLSELPLAIQGVDP